MTRPARRFSRAFALGVGATMVQGPDGNLHALTDSDELWRIVPRLTSRGYAFGTFRYRCLRPRTRGAPPATPEKESQ